MNNLASTETPCATVKLGTMTQRELLTAVQSVRYDAVSDYVPDLIMRLKISSNPVDLDVYLLDREVLGIADDGYEGMQQLLPRAEELGFMRCPAEVGPQFFLQHRERFREERIKVPIKTIIHPTTGYPAYFFLYNNRLSASWESYVSMNVQSLLCCRKPHINEQQQRLVAEYLLDDAGLHHFSLLAKQIEAQQPTFIETSGAGPVVDQIEEYMNAHGVSKVYALGRDKEDNFWELVLYWVQFMAMGISPSTHLYAEHRHLFGPSRPCFGCPRPEKEKLREFGFWERIESYNSPHQQPDHWKFMALYRYPPTAEEVQRMKEEE